MLKSRFTAWTFVFVRTSTVRLGRQDSNLSKLFYRYGQKEKNELTLALHLEIMPWQECMISSQMSDDELIGMDQDIRAIRKLLDESNESEDHSIEPPRYLQVATRRSPNALPLLVFML